GRGAYGLARGRAPGDRARSNASCCARCRARAERRPTPVISIACRVEAPWIAGLGRDAEEFQLMHARNVGIGVREALAVYAVVWSATACTLIAQSLVRGGGRESVFDCAAFQ